MGYDHEDLAMCGDGQTSDDGDGESSPATSRMLAVKRNRFFSLRDVNATAPTGEQLLVFPECFGQINSIDSGLNQSVLDEISIHESDPRTRRVRFCGPGVEDKDVNGGMSQSTLDLLSIYHDEPPRCLLVDDAGEHQVEMALEMGIVEEEPTPKVAGESQKAKPDVEDEALNYIRRTRAFEGDEVATHKADQLKGSEAGSRSLLFCVKRKRAFGRFRAPPRLDSIHEKEPAKAVDVDALLTSSEQELVSSLSVAFGRRQMIRRITV
jgi:hypothetical protein